MARAPGCRKPRYPSFLRTLGVSGDGCAPWEHVDSSHVEIRVAGAVDGPCGDAFAGLRPDDQCTRAIIRPGASARGLGCGRRRGGDGCSADRRGDRCAHGAHRALSGSLARTNLAGGRLSPASGAGLPVPGEARPGSHARARSRMGRERPRALELSRRARGDEQRFGLDGGIGKRRPHSVGRRAGIDPAVPLAALCGRSAEIR